MQVKVFIDYDLAATAHLTAGLCELEKRGLLSVSWRLPLRAYPKNSAPVVVRMEVTKSDGQVVRHAFDFHDVNDCWDMSALSWCNIYWKSNYNPGAVASLPERQRNKVRRYGLFFLPRSRRDRCVYLRLIGSVRARLSYLYHKYGKIRPFDLHSAMLARLGRYYSRLFIDEYESAATNRTIGVYFHPGCWPTDAETQTNLLRREIIQRLRRRVGDRFVGGFVNDAQARNRFPQEVYPHATDHRDYVRNLQNSHIVISTNGTSRCHSSRTGEALAAGAILVTETPVNEIDGHLVHGKNVFFYNTPAECESICHDILESGTDTLTALHAETNAYYDEYLEPGASLLKRLQGGT